MFWKSTTVAQQMEYFGGGFTFSDTFAELHDYLPFYSLTNKVPSFTSVGQDLPRSGSSLLKIFTSLKLKYTTWHVNRLYTSLP